MSDDKVTVFIEGETVEVPRDSLTSPCLGYSDASTINETAPDSIPEAVQQAAEAQPTPVVETPTHEGYHGNMLLEAQTVRHLCRLRVGRDAEVELLMDGEPCPPDEVVLISEHGWKDGAKKSWGRISAIHGPAGRPSWWGPRHKTAIERWMRAYKWLIAQRRERGGMHRSTLIGSRGKTRRY